MGDNKTALILILNTIVMIVCGIFTLSIVGYGIDNNAFDTKLVLLMLSFIAYFMVSGVSVLLISFEKTYPGEN